MRSNILDRVHVIARKRKLTKWTNCALLVSKSISPAREKYAYSNGSTARGPRHDITFVFSRSATLDTHVGRSLRTLRGIYVRRLTPMCRCSLPVTNHGAIRPTTRKGAGRIGTTLQSTGRADSMRIKLSEIWVIGRRDTAAAAAVPPYKSPILGEWFLTSMRMGRHRPAEHRPGDPDDRWCEAGPTAIATRMPISTTRTPLVGNGRCAVPPAPCSSATLTTSITSPNRRPPQPHPPPRTARSPRSAHPRGR
jgi:hypothetical protein